MTSESTVRVGVIGTGNLGTTLAEQVQAHEAGAVTAVADVDPDALARAGEALNVPLSNRYDDHETLLATAPVDAVAIATPHALHYEQTVVALDRGMDVLCEKPLTIDLDDARDLVERSTRGDQILMVGYQRHLYPSFIAARRLLRETDEQPTYITAETTQDWIRKFRGKWRTDPDLSGGGQLYDTGSHLIDAVLWVADIAPESVYAEMTFDDDERVDTNAALSVRFGNGAVGSLSVSGDTRQRYEHLHLATDSGGVRIENQTTVYEYDEAGDLSMVPADNNSRTPKGVAFVDAVLERSTPPATARDAYAVTAVTEAAYESARTGNRIEIDSTP